MLLSLAGAPQPGGHPILSPSILPSAPHSEVHQHQLQQPPGPECSPVSTPPAVPCWRNLGHCRGSTGCQRVGPQLCRCWAPFLMRTYRHCQPVLRAMPQRPAQAGGQVALAFKSQLIGLNVGLRMGLGLVHCPRQEGPSLRRAALTGMCPLMGLAWWIGSGQAERHVRTVSRLAMVTSAMAQLMPGVVALMPGAVLRWRRPRCLPDASWGPQCRHRRCWLRQRLSTRRWRRQEATRRLLTRVRGRDRWNGAAVGSPTAECAMTGPGGTGSCKARRPQDFKSPKAVGHSWWVRGAAVLLSLTRCRW
jgi:hypothetical protein